MVLDEEQLERMVGRPWRGPIPPTCPACGYNLTGLPDTRCPECGTRFAWRQVVRQARQAFLERGRLRHANTDAQAGMLMVGVGWLLWLLSWPIAIFVSSFIGVILAIIVAGLAVLAIVLGSQVFRLLRLPPNARKQLDDPPNLLLGTAVVLLALALLGADVLL